jgi:PhnB protein
MRIGEKRVGSVGVHSIFPPERRNRMGVNPIPEGYHTVTPYLVVEGAATVLDFVKEAFGAEEKFRMDMPGGKIGHAEAKIGDSIVMMGDAGEENPAMPAMIHLYVDDCDATYERALAAGGTTVREPENQFYGDRSAGVRDSTGNLWWIATHVEDVPEEELAKRMEESSVQPVS